MSITVLSTTDIQAKETPTKEGTSAPGESAEKSTQPAPEAKSSEQNASDSGTEEGKQSEEKTSVESETHESESDDGEEGEAEANAKPKKKGGFQRRIDKLNAKFSAAQAEAEHWKAMALKGAGDPQSKTPETQAKAAAASASNEGKPKPESFDTHAEFVEALADWKTEQKLKDRDQKTEQARLESEQAKLMKTHVERVKAFAESHEDFQDVLSEVDDVPLSPAVGQILTSSENGPALMYELAKNRAEYLRINQLPPLAAARAIGALEAKLSPTKEQKSETKKQTQAPKPIAPVGSKSIGVQKSIYDAANLTQKEYEALRAKQRNAG